MNTLDPVTALRRKHPGWTIELQAGVWVAVLRPTQTAQHILVGPGFDELAAKLDKADK